MSAKEKVERSAQERKGRDAKERAARLKREATSKGRAEGEATAKVKAEAGAVAKRSKAGKQHVYSKRDLLSFKEKDACISCPLDFLDSAIERGPSDSSGSNDLSQKDSGRWKDRATNERAKRLKRGAAAMCCAVEGAAAKAKEPAKRPKTGKRRVYNRMDLLRFKDMDVCICLALDLPDFTIERGPSRNSGSNNRHQSDGRRWMRGAADPPCRQYSSNFPKHQKQSNLKWERGQAPPLPKKNVSRRKYNSCGCNNNKPPTNFKPLILSEKGWRPKKNRPPLIMAEKQVKSILNKATKEKCKTPSIQTGEISLKSSNISVYLQRFKNIYLSLLLLILVVCFIQTR